MKLKEFMQSEGFKTVQLVKNPNTGKRFCSFDGGKFKTRVSSKVESLADSFVSWFEDSQDYCVVSSQNDANTLDSFTL